MKYFLFFAVFLICNPVLAAKPLGLKLDTYLIVQAQGSDTMEQDPRHTLSAQARVKAAYRFNDRVDGLVDTRAVGIEGNSGAEDETGRINTDSSFLELRQYWLRYDTGEYALQLGRQKIKDDIAFWWNRDIEAARIHYDSPNLKGFIGLAEAFSDYRTTDDSFTAEDDDRLRLLGEVSWQWQENHTLEPRFLLEYDHSGERELGSAVERQDRDDSDATTGWLGLRSHGDFKSFKYTLDLAGVSGSEDMLLTQGNSIIDKDHDNINGWGLSGFIDIPLDVAFKPLVTIGYAYGSKGFRQTDLQNNSGRLGGSSNPFYYFGEVLRPELSNMHIFTAGIGAPIGAAADLSFFYHAYQLDENAPALRRSLINTPLNNQDHFLGQEADILLNINVGDTLGLGQSVLRDLQWRNRLGLFRAGDAYGSSQGDHSVRGFSELVLHF